MENLQLVEDSTVSVEDSQPTSVESLKIGKDSGIPLHTKMVAAGLAACSADFLTYPIDTAKVRLQVQGESSPIASPQYKGLAGTINTIIRQEGGRALYNGLIPGLQRQLCFSSIRIGFYDNIKEGYASLLSCERKSMVVRIISGISSGALAVLCGQPTDVVKVRFQAAPPGMKPYPGVMAAYSTIAQREGIRGLWKGLLPNVARNSIVTTSELVSYDVFKDLLIDHGLTGDNIVCHFVSAFCAGFVTTCIASPVDVVKTRFMNATVGTYSGIYHCASEMVKREGFKAFYKGFGPSFMRIGTWNVLMFVSYEKLKHVLHSTTIPSVDVARNHSTNRYI